MKILLIEDDEAVATTIVESLLAQRHLVNTAGKGETGLELAKAYEYDLIVLDVGLPDLDGISLCRELRAQGYQVPILLLTAYDSSSDRVSGLDAGADDYLVKPFDLEELLARIRALLRRKNQALSPMITYGALRLDPGAKEFTYNNTLLRLTPKEYQLLELFVMNPRRVFSRGVILDRLWSMDEFPGEETITAHIKSLRQRLKAAGAQPSLIETVYGLGYRLQSPEKFESSSALSNRSDTVTALTASTVTVSEDRTQQAVIAIQALWQKFKAGFLAQVKVLEEVGIAADTNQLTTELLYKAKQDAHKLAGSLGTFGHDEGSRLARDIEILLQSETTLCSAKTQFLELVQTLHQELDNQPSIQLNFSQDTQPNPLHTDSARTKHHVLLIDDDVTLTQQISQAATHWHWHVQVASNPTSARTLLAQHHPDVILLDLTFSDSTEDGLTLLRQLAQQMPMIPVLIFTGRGSLSDRIEAAQLGGRAFLQKPASLEQIFNTVTQVLEQAQKNEAKVMVVDDDPSILETIGHLLAPWGLDTIPLADPEQFWEVLATTCPDVLIMDIEMPKINGIQLCQVVRNDPQWAKLPILILSAHTDAETRRQVFTVGADDYVQKPIVEPELVVRVINRIERSQIHRQFAKRLAYAQSSASIPEKTHEAKT
ncbi:multi-component transcriptional regulator [filamentous cyanobacterium CCP2]|nr:multi-component transcriptional regulator [filamentous cyanobacterium CCP2]